MRACSACLKCGTCGCCRKVSKVRRQKEGRKGQRKGREGVGVELEKHVRQFRAHYAMAGNKSAGIFTSMLPGALHWLRRRRLWHHPPYGSASHMFKCCGMCRTREEIREFLPHSCSKVNKSMPIWGAGLLSYANMCLSSLLTVGIFGGRGRRKGSQSKWEYQ